MLASGQLGVHNGLPVTVIVTVSAQDLEKGCGSGITGGGTRMPMRDVIRNASHSYLCLTVFDKHTGVPLYLGRTRRIHPVPMEVVHGLQVV